MHGSLSAVFSWGSARHRKSTRTAYFCSRFRAEAEMASMRRAAGVEQEEDCVHARGSNRAFQRAERRENTRVELRFKRVD